MAQATGLAVKAVAFDVIVEGFAPEATAVPVLGPSRVGRLVTQGSRRLCISSQVSRILTGPKAWVWDRGNQQMAVRPGIRGIQNEGKYLGDTPLQHRWNHRSIDAAPPPVHTSANAVVVAPDPRPAPPAPSLLPAHAVSDLWLSCSHSRADSNSSSNPHTPATDWAAVDAVSFVRPSICDGCRS